MAKVFAAFYCVLSLMLAATNICSAAEKSDVPRFIPPTTALSPDKKPFRIRFITADDFPPFNFIDGSGKLTGYNVELARAICARLSVPCTIQVRPFTLLLQTVVDNKADAIIAGVRESAALKAYLAYTKPYLRLPARFITSRRLTIDAVPETLSGLRVAVAARTRHADFLKDYFPKSVLVETTSDEDSYGRVKSGEVDAAFGSALSGAFWLSGPEASGCCRFAGGAYSDTAYFGSGLSIAVSKDNDLLRAALDDALRGLEAEGVTAELYGRFFPESLY